jgi:hypothetical protein
MNKYIFKFLSFFILGCAYCQADNPFDASLFQLYAINNIGSSSSFLDATGGNTPLMGAGGSIFTNGSSFPNNLGGEPYAMYAGGAVNAQNFVRATGYSGNNAIEAGGNIILTNSNITGTVHGGGNLQLTGTTLNQGAGIAGNASLIGGSNVIHGTIVANQPFTPTVNLSQISNYFIRASNFWASQPNNLTITPGTTFNLNPGLNVATLTLAQINSGQLNIGTIPSGSFLVINVSDVASSGTLNLTSFSSNGVNEIFNVPNVTNLTYNIAGSSANGIGILAPNSTLTIAANLGQVISGNIIGLNILGSNFSSANTSPFAGFQADENIFLVPEPSVYLMLGSLLLPLALIKRNKAINYNK